MNKDEMKNKYSAFIAEISEIMGLGKPIDILKLFATTDLFFQLLEKRIEELENEIIQLKDLLVELNDCIPSSMADSCRETLQKVALVFKED